MNLVRSQMIIFFLMYESQQVVKRKCMNNVQVQSLQSNYSKSIANEVQVVIVFGQASIRVSKTKKLKICQNTISLESSLYLLKSPKQLLGVLDTNWSLSNVLFFEKQIFLYFYNEALLLP